MRKNVIKNLAVLLSSVLLVSMLPAGMAAAAKGTPLSSGDSVVCKKKPVNIVLTLDMSSSMNTGNKLQNLKKAATAFVDSIFTKKDPNYKIALVTFNTDTHTLVGLSDFTKSAELKEVINELGIAGLTPSKGYTNMQKAINEVTKIKTDKNANKYMVLISDGVPTLSYKGKKAISYPNWYNFHDLSYDYKITKFDYKDDDVVGNGKTFKLPNSYNVKHGHFNYVVKDNGIATMSEAFLAREKHWTIYTIGCNVNAEAQYILYNCASDKSYYINANKSDLTETIKNLVIK